MRSAFSAGGPRAVKPVEIASALRQAMDDESFALSEGHTVAPNSYVVHFSPADFDRARSWGSTLASELCDEVIRHADSQGYALPGTVRVAFHPDTDVRAGDLRVVTGLDDGSLPAPAPRRRRLARHRPRPGGDCHGAGPTGRGPARRPHPVSAPRPARRAPSGAPPGRRARPRRPADRRDGPPRDGALRPGPRAGRPHAPLGRGRPDPRPLRRACRPRDPGLLGVPRAPAPAHRRLHGHAAGPGQPQRRARQRPPRGRFRHPARRRRGDRRPDRAAVLQRDGGRA